MILRFWEGVLDLALRRPGRVILAAGAAFVLLGALILLRLDVRTDLEGLVPTEAARVLEEIDRLFGAGRRAFLIVTDTQARPEGAPERSAESGEARLLGFARRLEGALASSPGIESVEHGFGEAAARLLGELALPHGPLFTPPHELGALDRRLTPEGIEAAVEKLAALLRLPGLSPLESLAAADPLDLRGPIVERFAALRGAFRFHPSSLDALSADGRSLLVTVTGRPPLEDLAGAKRVVKEIRGAWGKVLAEPWALGLEVAATGGYFLAAESEEVIRGDIASTSVGSMAMVAVLSAAALRRLLPLAAGIAVLLLSIVSGLALTALLVGRMEALALGAAAILIGASDDFVVHIASLTLRYRSAGEPLEGALRRATLSAEPELRYAALTTIAAFLTFLLARQEFLKHMGILAALGILCAYVSALSVYPALLYLLMKGDRRPTPPPRALGLGPAAALALGFPRTVLWGSLALSVGAVIALAARPPRFETDLRNIHARGSPAIRAQERIREAFQGSAEPIALLIERKAEGEAVEAARRLAGPLDALRGEGKIAGWASIAQLIPSPAEQEKAIRVLEKKDGRALAGALAAALERQGFEPKAFARSIEGLRRIDSVRAPIDAARLRELSERPLGNWVSGLLRTDGERSLALVAVYPRTDLWTAEERAGTQEAVEGAARRAGVEVKAASLYTVSAESAREVGKDFLRVSVAAAAAVVVLVAIQFRSLGWSLLVLLPVALGCLWMAAAFTLLGFKINFMNITVLPMILGIGVDSGIHIVGRFLHQGREARTSVSSTLVGVVLATTTTMAGFGSLAFSRNQGLASIGVVSLIGMASCLAASLLTLPAALRLVEDRGRRIRRGS